jgi:lipoyl(octanoyl) transferase
MFDSLDLIESSVAFDGPMQMALDEVLFLSVVRPTLRIYRWSAPWVTYGYFQKRATVLSLYPEFPSVRRSSGGGSVLHDGDLTFSVIVPAGDLATPRSSSAFYQRLHGAVSQWVGPKVRESIRLASRGDEVSGDACFSSPASNDLLADGRKILGGAMRRTAGALLYQGSLQIQGYSLENPAMMAEAFSQRLRKVLLTEETLIAAEDLAAKRYRTESWNAFR